MIEEEPGRHSEMLITYIFRDDFCYTIHSYRYLPHTPQACQAFADAALERLPALAYFDIGHRAQILLPAAIVPRLIKIIDGHPASTIPAFAAATPYNRRQFRFHTRPA